MLKLENPDKQQHRGKWPQASVQRRDGRNLAASRLRSKGTRRGQPGVTSGQACVPPAPLSDGANEGPDGGVKYYLLDWRERGGVQGWLGGVAVMAGTSGGHAEVKSREPETRNTMAGSSATSVVRHIQQGEM